MLLHPGRSSCTRYQVERDDFSQCLWLDRENDAFKGSNLLFQGVADVQLRVLVDLLHSHVEHLFAKLAYLLYLLIALLVE